MWPQLMSSLLMLVKNGMTWQKIGEHGQLCVEMGFHHQQTNIDTGLVQLNLSRSNRAGNHSCPCGQTLRCQGDLTRLSRFCDSVSALSTSSHLVIYPRRVRMRSEGYGTWSVCVCVSIDDYSQTVGNEATKQQYQQVQCYTGLILKVLHSKVMVRNTSKKANMLISLSSPEAVFTHLRNQ